MAISQVVKASLGSSSWIRQMFEEGLRLKELYGADQVFDFSLGNPVLEPPAQVHETLIKLLRDSAPGMHRYMPNAGFSSTRQYIAQELRAGTKFFFTPEDIVMCVGAGGGLNAVFKALLDPGDEVLALAPYFVEYGFYAQNHGGLLTVAPTDAQFQIDLAQIEAKLTPKTKIVIINSPNNPTGVVYSQASLDALGQLLVAKEQAYGHPIFLVSDEPYKFILFDGLQPASVFQSHVNTILVTSHSKDLGLAGERIGYIAIHPEMPDRLDAQNAIVFATRTLGFVNAPALMQRILPHLKGVKVPIETYQHLRDLLYHELTQLGFEIVRPQGAFYMFPKSPLPDDLAFVKAAQQENILLVPGRGFGAPGYFRISYCFTEDMIRRSLPRFKVLAKKLSLSK